MKNNQKLQIASRDGVESSAFKNTVGKFCICKFDRFIEKKRLILLFTYLINY